MTVTQFGIETVSSETVEGTLEEAARSRPDTWLRLVTEANGCIRHRGEKEGEVEYYRVIWLSETEQFFLVQENGRWLDVLHGSRRGTPIAGPWSNPAAPEFSEDLSVRRFDLFQERIEAAIRIFQVVPALPTPTTLKEEMDHHLDRVDSSGSDPLFLLGFLDLLRLLGFLR